MKVTFKTVLLGLLLSSCVQETHVKVVTFQVDMSGVEKVENVGVRGNFTPNQWRETVPLTDENNDGIYEGTFSQKTAVNQIQFKFVNQNSDYELKKMDNRVLKFEYKPEKIIYKAIFNNANDIEVIMGIFD